MAVEQTLTLTETAVYAADNSSRVSILWMSKQTGDSWNGYTRTAKYWVSINGEAETEYSISYTLPQNSNATIVHKVITVPHREDGTGEVKVRTWMDTSISAGVVHKTSELTLTTIPRETTITSLSYELPRLDTKLGFQYTPKSANYYNRCVIDLNIGGKLTQIRSIDLGKKGAWNQPTQFVTLTESELATIYNALPNTNKGVLRFTIYTYTAYDGVAYKTVDRIGDGSYKEATLNIPTTDATKPTIQMVLSPVTTYAKFASLYLRGRSAVKATFSGQGKYGATIASYSMQVEGKTYSSPYTSDTLRASGNVTVTGKVTDSRGITNTITQTINVIAYDPPYIAPLASQTAVVCERCNEDGTQSDSGAYLRVKGTRNYTKIDTGDIVNTCSVRCRCKPEGGTWSHDDGKGVGVLLWTDTSTNEFDVILSNIVTDPLRAYTVELNIIDDTYEPSAMVFDIPSENVDFELKEGGGGASFGKHAVEDDMLDCAWNAKFHKNLSIQGEAVADFVVEQGIDGTWYVRKWYSGIAECWYKRNADVNVDAQWGTALYYGTVAATYYPPTLFVEIPSCQITCEYGEDNVSLFLATSGSSSTGRTPTVMLCRTDPQLVNVNIQYYAMGKWK